MTLGVVGQVIWVIGGSMIVLAGLIHLPCAAIAAFGLALVLGHNLLDGITPAQLGRVRPALEGAARAGSLEIVPVFLLYPLIPSVGVMALGYAAGPAVFSEKAGSARRPAWAGALSAWKDLWETPASERVKCGKVEHETQQTLASGDTNSRKWWQVAGVEAVTTAPLDQESPGSSPGGAIKPGNDLAVVGLRLFTRLP